MPEGKTIAEWIETIQDPEIKRRVIIYIEKNYSRKVSELRGLNHLFKSFKSFLSAMFVFDASPEGGTFWMYFQENPGATFLELEHLLPGGSHLAKHKDDAVKDPLLKEIEELKTKESGLYAEIELWNTQYTILKAKYDCAVELMKKVVYEDVEFGELRNSRQQVESFLNEVKQKA